MFLISYVSEEMADGMFSLYIPTTIPPKFTGECFLCQQYITKCPVLATTAFTFQYLFDFYLFPAFLNKKKKKWYLLQHPCQKTNTLIHVPLKLLEKVPLFQGVVF